MLATKHDHMTPVIGAESPTRNAVSHGTLHDSVKVEVYWVVNAIAL